LSELALIQLETVQQTKTIEPHGTQIPKARTSEGRQGPYQLTTPDRACRLLEIIQVSTVGNDFLLQRGADVKALVLVVHRPCTLLHDHLWSWRCLRTRGAEVTALTSGGRRCTSPGPVRLRRRRCPSSDGRAHHVGRRGRRNSTTGVSGNLLPNASWPEAFFSLSDIVGGTLLMIGYLSKQQIESRNAVLSYGQDC
jgi:hypothetical protein